MSIAKEMLRTYSLWKFFNQTIYTINFTINVVQTSIFIWGGVFTYIKNLQCVHFVCVYAFWVYEKPTAFCQFSLIVCIKNIVRKKTFPIWLYFVVRLKMLILNYLFLDQNTLSHNLNGKTILKNKSIDNYKHLFKVICVIHWNRNPTIVVIQ